MECKHARHLTGSSIGLLTPMHARIMVDVGTWACTKPESGPLCAGHQLYQWPRTPARNISLSSKWMVCLCCCWGALASPVWHDWLSSAATPFLTSHQTTAPKTQIFPLPPPLWVPHPPLPSQQAIWHTPHLWIHLALEPTTDNAFLWYRWVLTASAFV